MKEAEANNMNGDISARAHWLMGYGLPRATLKLLARTGDPFAQLLIDSSQPKNLYHLVEQIRQRGRMYAAVGGSVWVTADAQIVRDVLRDNRFRTINPSERSPFRVVRRMLAKTDPNPDGLNGMAIAVTARH